MKRKKQTQAPLPSASQPWQRVELCCSAVRVTSSIPNVLDTNCSTSATGVLLTRISWKTLLSFQQRNGSHLLNMITNCIILTANSFALPVRLQKRTLSPCISNRWWEWCRWLSLRGPLLCKWCPFQGHHSLYLPVRKWWMISENSLVIHEKWYHHTGTLTC